VLPVRHCLGGRRTDFFSPLPPTSLLPPSTPALDPLGILHEQRHALLGSRYVELAYTRITHLPGLCRVAFVLTTRRASPTYYKGRSTSPGKLEAPVSFVARFCPATTPYSRRRTDEEPAPNRRLASVQLWRCQIEGLEFKCGPRRPDRPVKRRGAPLSWTAQPAPTTALSPMPDFRLRKRPLKNKTNVETVEKSRWFYVAATRAKERLSIPWFKDNATGSISWALSRLRVKLVEFPDLWNVPCCVRRIFS